MQKVIIFLSLVSVGLGLSPLKSQNLDKEIEAIVAPLVTAISAQTVKNVAISDFTSLDGTPSELGKYLAEEFSYHLVNAKKTFIVIDRSRVSALLKENGLASSGLVDPNTIAKLGKMKGIDAVIAGTLTPTGNTIRLIVKVWSLETQGLVAAAKGDISETSMIKGLREKLSTEQIEPVIKNNPPGISPSLTVAKFVKGHLTCELISCTQSNQNIECKVRYISDGKDENLQVIHHVMDGRPSRIITSSGREYNLTESRLLDKILTGNSYHEKTMVSNLPLICTFIFSNVNEKVVNIERLQINNHTPSLNWFQTELKNIPVK